MNKEKILERLLALTMQYKQAQRALLQVAMDSDIWEVKDEHYRKAAIEGLRLASVDKALATIHEANSSDLKCLRSLQRHNRDMARLYYKARHPRVDSDALDQEVLSQFNTVGIVINDKPHNYRRNEKLMGVKIK